MKRNLTMVRDALEVVDNNVEKSLYFYNTPSARVRFLQDLIAFTVSQTEGDKPDWEKETKYREISTFLDNHFQKHAWPAHEVHFHTNFMQHAGCTFTCINEISSIIEKIIKENFAS